MLCGGEVAVEAWGPRIEEQVVRVIEPVAGAVIRERVERPTDPVGSQAVQAGVLHEGGGIDRVQDALDPRPDGASVGGFPPPCAPLGDPGEVQQVVALVFVELQCPGDRFHNFTGRSGDFPAFQPGVVVHADTGKVGHLFAAQPRDPAGSAVERDACLLRGELGAPGSEEAADLGPGIHSSKGRPAAFGAGRACGFLPAAGAGSPPGPSVGGVSTMPGRS